MILVIYTNHMQFENNTWNVLSGFNSGLFGNVVLNNIKYDYFMHK